MNVETLLERSAHADLVRLAEHCRVLAGNRPLPRWEDFRPAEVRWMLGRLYMVDVLDDGADYCFRLFGTFWQTIYGTDFTGQRLSGLEAIGVLPGLRSNYDVVAKTRKPLFHPGMLVWPDNISISFERLLIPFSLDDGEVSIILGAAYCDKAEEFDLYMGSGLPRLASDEQS